MLYIVQNLLFYTIYCGQPKSKYNKHIGFMMTWKRKKWRDKESVLLTNSLKVGCSHTLIHSVRRSDEISIKYIAYIIRRLLYN